MNSNYQYYANRNLQENSNRGQRIHACVEPVINDRNFNYLLRRNFLSEYSTEEDLLEVLYNLGLLQRLNKLKQLIDAKVIESGGVAWDESPTLGNTELVLSSDTLKQEFLKYYTKTQVDNLIQEIWNRIVNEIPDLSNLERITNILNEILEIKGSLQEETLRALGAEKTISDRVTELEEHGVNPEDNIKHIILTQEEFENLTEQEPNVLYIIVKQTETKTESKFGDPFPFILGQTESRFGNSFPFILG